MLLARIRSRTAGQIAACRARYSSAFSGRKRITLATRFIRVGCSWCSGPCRMEFLPTMTRSLDPPVVVRCEDAHRPVRAEHDAGEPETLQQVVNDGAY